MLQLRENDKKIIKEIISGILKRDNKKIEKKQTFHLIISLDPEDCKDEHSNLS